MAYVSPYKFFVHRRRAFGSLIGAPCAFNKLPARFARLPWMAAIVVSPTTASTAKTIAPTPWTLRLGFGLVDSQCPSTQIGSIQGRDRFVGFTGIGHFDEPETAGAARIPIGHDCDLFDYAMRLEDISQLRFTCAMRQISYVKVLHCNSSLSKSSRLVGVVVGFDGRPRNLVAERAGRASLWCGRGTWSGLRRFAVKIP